MAAFSEGRPKLWFVDLGEEEGKVARVLVKLWPGKSEEQKTRLSEAITKQIMEVLHYGEESVSYGDGISQTSGLGRECL